MAINAVDDRKFEIKSAKKKNSNKKAEFLLKKDNSAKSYYLLHSKHE